MTARSGEDSTEWKAVMWLARAMQANDAGSSFRSHLDLGEIAALRRLDLRKPASTAFWRVAARMEHELGRNLGSKEEEERWALLLQAMALMAPNPHEKGKHAGVILAASKYSDLRLERLLRARDTAFHDSVTTMARFLRSKGQRVDWVGLAPLILSDPERAEGRRAREGLARDYYRHHATLSDSDTETA